MKLFLRLLRLLRINFVLVRYNIDEIVLGGTGWLFPLRIFTYLNPYYWLTNRMLARGVRIRLALEALGPIFIKAGQIISTRPDLLPEDIILELAKLQDKVPPFPGTVAKTIIEKTFNCPLNKVFATFEFQALASASIAQVHAATLLTGEEAAAKILRPDIRVIIERDADLLITLAKLAHTYWKYSNYFKPREIVSEIVQTLYDELDLLREGANASQLKRNFSNTQILHVPKIYWHFCYQNILVLERVYGVPIYALETLKAAHVDMKKLAQRGIEIFFTQVFRDSFFHADLHPGNIFVNIKDPSDPSHIVVDFGIVGSLSSADQRYLAENLVAFFKRDYRKVAELHIASGWLPKTTRVDQFESAIRAVSEPILSQPLYDVSFGKLLLRLFQVARRFQLNIQPQLVLLQKSLINIESLSRALDKELDLWAFASPQIEKWLKKQLGLRALLNKLRENFPVWCEELPEIPSLLYARLKEPNYFSIPGNLSDPEYNSMLLPYKNNNKSAHLSYFFGGVFFTLLVSGMIFWLLH